jgi:hypothetical protein
MRTGQVRIRSSQAQWYFDDPRLHFEAWWHANTGRLELGLHLEADPELNERIARGLAARLLMIKGRLGPGIDLEPWEKGWVRLYETTPVELFDDERIRSTATRMAELIRVLWPLCVECRDRLPPPASRGKRQNGGAKIRSARAGVTQR